VSRETLRRRVLRVLHVDNASGSTGHYINVALCGVIVLSIGVVALETITRIDSHIGGLLLGIEYACLVVFSIEYVLRLWGCVANPLYARPILGRLRYALTPMALVDLLAIAPSYLPFLGINLMTLRAFRLLRLLRLLKLGRYSEALQLMARVVRNKRAELASTAILAGFLLLVAAALLHAAEGEVQPERFGSLPDSMWWAVETLTTVGYGDVYPQTTVGKMLGSIVAFLGVGLFALPTAILGAGFLQEAGRKNPANDKRRACPHCGKSLEV
jgi:voltage-gated potassium channel